jgi:hypothetical protein
MYKYFYVNLQYYALDIYCSASISNEILRANGTHVVSFTFSVGLAVLEMSQYKTVNAPKLLHHSYMSGLA